ncbi:MAG TPA: uracil-DNA glycosylase [Candidatus Wunengus sp. YC60]|uniref:uracil-DNA glycosylase n=1 Tax=Candidatus Wunengus sp. YC60 TaxID=3367697 RepID=UPI0040260294
MDEIRRELASILNAVKTRIDLEKRFGVDTITLSQSNKAISQSLPKVVPQIKPIEVAVVIKPIKEHISASWAGTNVCPPNDSIKISGDQTFMGEKERKIKLLEELKNEMLACHKCPLGKTRTNLVFGVGDPMARLMFVGEAPGRDEDLQGEPFVGRAGQLLTKIIEAIGLKRSDVYIANVLKCRPPENRNPLPEEIVLCMPYLIKQIEVIQPKVLCALGTFAAQTLLNTKAPVGTLRGKFHEYKGIPMMVTYHPAYLLRNPNDKAKVWDDMKKVRDFLGELSGKDLKM